MGTYVISGSNGYIGSNLSKYISESGNTVYALISKGKSSEFIFQNNPNIIVIQIDYSLETLETLSLPINPDAFIHLAWSGVDPHFKNDFDVQIKNIELSVKCLKLASKLKAKKFILPGSAMEYAFNNGDIDGTTLPTPLNTYASIKTANRFICEAYAKDLEVPFIYTIITSVYGPGREDNNVIFYTIKKLLINEKPSLSALVQKWNFVHIDDCIEALYLISIKGKYGKTYAIGSIENWPLRDYIEIIKNIINSKAILGIGEIPFNSNRVPTSSIDISALKEDLDFTPKKEFNDGIREVIELYARGTR